MRGEIPRPRLDLWPMIWPTLITFDDNFSQPRPKKTLIFMTLTFQWRETFQSSSNVVMHPAAPAPSSPRKSTQQREHWGRAQGLTALARKHRPRHYSKPNPPWLCKHWRVQPVPETPGFHFARSFLKKKKIIMNFREIVSSKR